jgi:hypothetical protein
VAHSLLNRSSWWESPRLAGLASLPPALLALGVCCYQLAYPHVLHGVFSYDDGVYFGSAVYLIHGVVPYRDFAFVVPPGITLLMTPFALLTHVMSSNEALGVARIFTAVVTGANAMLAGLAVRHRGVAASAAAAPVLAIFPSAYLADSTVLLEPYLVFFCLLGAVLLFQNGHLATPRRAWLAGLAFGFGAAVELWAVIPLVIALAFSVPVWRRAVLPLLGGAVIGLGLPSVPFVLLGPNAFGRDVVLTQLGRTPSGPVAGTGARFLNLTGIGPALHLHASGHAAIEIGIGAALVLGLIFVVAGATRRSSRFDGFAFASMVVVTLVIMVVPTFYGHDTYFAAPFVAIVFGLAVRYLLEVLTWIIQSVAGGSYVSVDFAARTGLSFIAVALVVAGAVTTVRREATFSRTFFATVTESPGPAVAASLPPGGCVVTDETSLVISGNRFSVGPVGCPTVLDSFGTWLAASPEHPPQSPGPPDASLVAEWRDWLGQADYVVLTTPGSTRIPWTPALRRFFARTFVSVSNPPGAAIYRRSDNALLTAARAG